MDSNITIIGAGVVGLAIAAKFSLDHHSIFVIEKHKRFGQETSSRNSEVIHSGIYYPEGSLKAGLCAEGREMIYSYCHRNNISYRRCGKLIVAENKEEAGQLPEILDGAIRNGVEDAKIMNKQEVLDLEPYIHTCGGIYFPSSGIIDSHGLMKQLETDSINNGVHFVYGAEVIHIERIRGGYRIELKDSDDQQFKYTSKIVINSAGLSASSVAGLAGITNPEYNVHLWKGEYFHVGNGKHKYLNRLVYPFPESNTVGLGIHATIGLDNRLKLGPNTIFLPDGIIDYTVDPEHRKQFYESAVRIFPFLELDDLYPDQAGIRPKLQKPGDPAGDFIIREESGRDLPGFINLLGIESPGLTACLSIAEYVLNLSGK